MQYGVSGHGLKVYEGKEVESKVEFRSEPTKLLIIFIATLLISRVTIMIGEGDLSGISPFGLAFLISVIQSRDKGRILTAGSGALIGYFTINRMLDEGWIYVFTILIVLAYSLIVDKFNKVANEKQLFLVIFASYVIYGSIISNYDLGVNITMSAVNAIVIIPIYYIIRYGLRCVSEYNTNYFFNIEELMSIGIILCLIVSGIGSIGAFNVSLRDIVSLATVICVAYVGGATNGAALGVVMGVILGITTGHMISGIGLYGTVGLVVGLFKETGKVFSFLSAIIVYLILGLYSNTLDLRGIIEVVVGGGIFLIISKKVLNFLEVEMCSESKMEAVNEEHLLKVKEEFSKKVQGFSDVLDLVSSSLNKISENDKLSYKKRSVGMVENLADRVCSTCVRCDKCWGREFNQTYNACSTLLKSREEGLPNFPIELEKKCVKKFDLIKNGDDILHIILANEITKKKLEEGRELVSNHIKSISLNLDNMISDFKRDITWCGELERVIRRELNKNSIKYNNVFCFNDKGGRMNIKIRMDNSGGSNYCINSVLPVVNEVMRTPMMVREDGYKITPDNKECIILLEEMPKYKVVSYAGMRAKEGEQYTGDTYSFGAVEGGKYLTLLSDGMGSGPEAGRESRITVDLIEKFLEEGFDVETALNTVNSIMSMKFEEDEKFSTLDLNVIDLYNGKASFVKVGAAASFIKRGNKIKKISSNMPPFGLVDKIEIESSEERVKNGDIIITLSDGVLDVDKKGVGDSTWLEDYLSTKGNNPKELVESILEESRSINDGKIKDDMTIVVSKVYSIY